REKIEVGAGDLLRPARVRVRSKNVNDAIQKEKAHVAVGESPNAGTRSLAGGDESLLWTDIYRLGSQGGQRTEHDQCERRHQAGHSTHDVLALQSKTQDGAYLLLLFLAVGL